MTIEKTLVNENFWIACLKCKMAYVVRRRQHIAGHWIWCWEQDCKCRKSEPFIDYLPETQPRMYYGEGYGEGGETAGPQSESERKGTGE